jgi:hypothetical protein
MRIIELQVIALDSKESEAFKEQRDEEVVPPFAPFLIRRYGYLDSGRRSSLSQIQHHRRERPHLNFMA